MRKVYSLSEGDWAWDTDTLKWTSPRRFSKPADVPVIQEIKAKTKSEWEKWTEYVFQVFVDYRLSPGWETLKACHDEDDRMYFAMLEELYQNGKIKV